MNPEPSPRKNRFKRIVLVAALGIATLIGAARVLGLLIPYHHPTESMKPAVNKGDSIFVEGFTYLLRKPMRGDVVAFETSGVSGIIPPPGTTSQVFLKRVAGLPGETLQIANGQLIVNGTPTPLYNETGPIHYTNLSYPTGMLQTPTESVVVPPDMYFVLGDNSPNSADSRLWGFVPAKNIVGRVALRFLPLKQIGPIK
jgi:signal peptidase I